MSLLSLFNIDTLRQRAARMAIVQLTLTEQFNQEPTQPLTPQTWELVYSEALTKLPNNTIMNIISKARTEPYRQTVLALFQTSEKVEFRFERPDSMHGLNASCGNSRPSSSLSFRPGTGRSIFCFAMRGSVTGSN